MLTGHDESCRCADDGAAQDEREQVLVQQVEAGQRQGGHLGVGPEGQLLRHKQDSLKIFFSYPPPHNLPAA